MSYFVSINDVTVENIYKFQTPAVGVQNFIKCKGGEVVGWEYWMTDDDGYDLVKLYNASNGLTENIGTVYAMKGADIFRGMFSTGVIPSAGILDAECAFYRIDYV